MHTHSQSLPAVDETTMHQLIEGWFTDSLTASECQLLAQLLGSSPVFQERFRVYAEEQAALMMVAQRSAAWQQVEDGERLHYPAKADAEPKATWTWQIIPVTAAAAAAAIALWFALPLAGNGGQGPGAEPQTASLLPEPPESHDGEALPAKGAELRLRLQQPSPQNVQVVHDLGQQRRVTVRVSESSSHRR